MIRAQVIVRPRASIFDPQGDAVLRAVQHLGLAAVKQAHVGKFIELELEAKDLAKARAQLETICQDLLSNPVIEDYALTLDGATAKPVAAKKAVKPAKAKAKSAASKPVKESAPKSKAKSKPKPGKKKAAKAKKTRKK